METLNPGENTSSLIELHDEIESRRGKIRFFCFVSSRYD